MLIKDHDRPRAGGAVGFHLDFHTIPFHGEDTLIEKHYVSKRSRRQKGMLALLAQDAEQHVFCYANAEIRKADQTDEILRFVNLWKARTGNLPQELIFDSKLTTYANLRRRSAGLLAELAASLASAWQRIKLKNVTRAYRTPNILDRKTPCASMTTPSARSPSPTSATKNPPCSSPTNSAEAPPD